MQVKHLNDIHRPIFLVKEKMILLDFNSFSQFLYQFSHEIMHYQIYQKEGKTMVFDEKTSKAQELLCCAFSFFILKNLQHHNYLTQQTTNNNHLYKKWMPEILQLWNKLSWENLEIIIDKTIIEWKLERTYCK